MCVNKQFLLLNTCCLSSGLKEEVVSKRFASASGREASSKFLFFFEIKLLCVTTLYNYILKSSSANITSS